MLETPIISMHILMKIKSFCLSSPSQNELVYYPTIPGIPASQVLVSPEVNPGITPANTQRFTPPPHGLVNAIFAWFAENNIPVPDGPGKNGK